MSVLRTWGTASFNNDLTNEIMLLKVGALPLQQCLVQGDMASEHASKITVLSSKENETELVVNLAVYFTEIISGCSCGDDPAILNGYCEMQLNINKVSGDAGFRVAD